WLQRHEAKLSDPLPAIGKYQLVRALPAQYRQPFAHPVGDHTAIRFTDLIKHDKCVQGRPAYRQATQNAFFSSSREIQTILDVEPVQFAGRLSLFEKHGLRVRWRTEAAGQRKNGIRVYNTQIGERL